MFTKRTLLIPLFVATAAVAGCGGGGNEEAVAEQADDAAATAADVVEEAGDVAADAGNDATTAAESVGDAATDVASDAAAAVEDTAGAVSDVIDPEAWQDIEMNWDSQISSVQETFPDLSEDEIAGTAGKPDNLVSLVEQKYGISRDEAMARVSEWASSL